MTGSARLRGALVVVGLVVLVAGIAWLGRDARPTPRTTFRPVVSATPAAGTVGAAPVVAWDESGNAPPVTLAIGGRAVPSTAWSSCYGKGERWACADGAPGLDGKPLPDAGTASEVAFSFPDPGWTFTATFHEALEQQDCGRAYPGRVEVTSDHTFTAYPAGPAGTYRVDLFGRGPEGGDVVTSLLWTTPVAGALPAPASRLALLADNGGRLDTYGLELELRNLPADRPDVRAVVRVTASDGTSLTLAGLSAKGGCHDEGSALLTLPPERVRDVSDLGPGPFRYDVDLTADGMTHRATATYPDDLIAGAEPSVALRFDPPLPSLGESPAG